jgi:phospholipid N-methyltransferase
MYDLSLKDIEIGIDELHGKTILDYGCANGVFLDLLKIKYKCKNNDLYGFDISNDFMNQIIKKGYNS